MTDPLRNIEDRKAQYDIGVMAIRVYQGAMSEANDTWEAICACAGYWIAIFNKFEEGGDSQ